MTLRTATMRGRDAAAKYRLIDECQIKRNTGQLTGDGRPVRDVVYEGRCAVQSYEAWERDVGTAEAGHTFVVQRIRVDLPIGEFDPAIGDLVRVVASRLDPHLVGRRFMIGSVLHKTAATSRRCFADEDLEQDARHG